MKAPIANPDANRRFAEVTGYAAAWMQEDTWPPSDKNKLHLVMQTATHSKYQTAICKHRPGLGWIGGEVAELPKCKNCEKRLETYLRHNSVISDGVAKTEGANEVD